MGEVYDEYDRSKMQIIPTVFSKNKKEFTDRLNKLVPISKKIQIDIMDGKFVKNKSVGIKYVPNLDTYKNIFEAHLMVKNPEKYVEELYTKGFKKIIFHYNAINDKEKIIKLKNKIEKKRMTPVLALNPETKISQVKDILHYFKYVLIMGINPGKEKQKLLPTTYNKVRRLSREFPRILLQIDGGVNKETAPKLHKAGADILNSGSFVANAKNPKKAIEELK